MTHQNSLDAYNALSASGVLASGQLKAWRLLREHGPITVQELISLTKVNGRSLHCRVSELQSLGLAKPYENRICSVSGFKAAAYVATIPTGVITPKEKPREFWIAAHHGEPTSISFTRFPHQPNDGWEFIKVREVKSKK